MPKAKDHPGFCQFKVYLSWCGGVTVFISGHGVWASGGMVGHGKRCCNADVSPCEDVGCFYQTIIDVDFKIYLKHI